jgi:Trk K+ transport system NAD-binding subunit
MKAVVIGTGAVGHAVTRALTKYGHQVVTVGRNSGDHRAGLRAMSNPFNDHILKTAQHQPVTVRK